MQPDDFRPDAAGRVVRAPEGYWAFLPDPLPPALEPSWDLFSRLSEADRALSELAGRAANLPNPHLLIAPFLRREAVLSSRIEGTQASLSDLFFFEAGSASARSATRRVPDDVQEVANYVRALEYGLKRTATLPISLRLIREIHGRLMKGVRGNHLTPGEFRRTPNWIGSAGCTLMDATYVPPPVPDMHDALDRFEKYLHQRPTLPPLVRLALLHYQFEAIHPFVDGNGRVGRLLIPLLLCHEGLLPQPLLYLSAYFERHRPEYYRHLLTVSQTGSWADWVVFFLTGVADQARDALARSARLIDLRERHRRKLASARSSALLLSTVDLVFELPVLSIAMVASRLRVTPRSAALNVGKLVDAGILVETTGRARGRFFMARRVIEIVEGRSGTSA
jgi:Fic family protein